MGEQLADIAELHEAGCVAITDDGRPVATALLMRRALEYASMFDMPVIEHCEEQTLKARRRRPRGLSGVDAWACAAFPAKPNRSWRCATSRSPS